MASRRFFLSPSARRFLDIQDNQTRGRLVDILLWLCDHPYGDPEDPNKSMFLAPPVMMRKFQDYFHWIIYYLDGDSEAGVESDARLIVANIGRVGEAPRPTRQA